MRRCLLAVVILILLSCVADAKIYVLKTDATISVDGNLSEWVYSTVLTWNSPFSNVDLNYIYLLHSDDSYFVGLKIYDDDNIDDDIVTIYLNDSMFVLNEGLSTVTAYKRINGSWNLANTNATVTYTRSNPYSYVEFKIPKVELNNSSNLLFYLEYVSTHIRDVYSSYPSDADANDTGTWQEIQFVEMLNRTLTLNVSDRDGVPIDYATDDFVLEFRYSSNNTPILSTLGRSHTTVELPPSQITMVVKFLGTPIFEKTYDLTYSNVSDSISINNLLKVDTPLGYMVISVEKNGTLKSVDFDYSKERAIIVSQSSEILFDSKLPWSFLAVLYADSYSYNPITNHLAVKLNASKDSGLVLVVGNNDTASLVYTNNSIIFYSVEDEKYCFKVKKGFYKIYHAKSPFSIAFNGKALKKKVDYSTEGNYTTIIVSSDGLIEVYYRNPVSVKLDVNAGNFKIYVATPYEFNGKVRYIVRIHNQTIEDRTVNFKATPPLTLVEINPSTYGDTEIHVYDVDSNTELYSTTEKVFTLPELWVIASVIVAVVAIITLITISRRGKEKARTIEEKGWKFFRRLK